MLWICTIYLGFASLFIFARASWGFLRLGSEYRDNMVPQEVLFNIVESASNDFWNHSYLMLIGFLLLAIITYSITRNKK